MIHMACRVKRKRWNYKQIYERVLEKWQRKEMKAANCWISCCFSTRPSQSRAPWTLFCLGSVPDSRCKEDIRWLLWASDRGLFIISPSLRRNGNANFQAEGCFTNVHTCVSVCTPLFLLWYQRWIKETQLSKTVNFYFNLKAFRKVNILYSCCYSSYKYGSLNFPCAENNDFFSSTWNTGVLSLAPVGKEGRRKWSIQIWGM